LSPLGHLISKYSAYSIGKVSSVDIGKRQSSFPSNLAVNYRNASSPDRRSHDGVNRSLMFSDIPSSQDTYVPPDYKCDLFLNYNGIYLDPVQNDMANIIVNHLPLPSAITEISYDILGDFLRNQGPLQYHRVSGKLYYPKSIRPRPD
jgi:hypothetical protein